MEKRHIILTGPIRSGSTWLTDMLSENVDPGLAEFGHEDFSRDYPGTLKRWSRGKPKIYGTVGHDHMFFPMLEEAFKPTWVFMWREPLQLIESIFRWVSRNKKREPRTDEIYMRAFTIYSGLEVALAAAARRGADVSHWHFSHYTTRDGFVHLAEFLKLPLRSNLVMVDSKNSSPKLYVKASRWPKTARQYIYSFVESLPNVWAAYNGAKKG